MADRNLASIVDKSKQPDMKHNLNIALPEYRLGNNGHGSIDRRIRAFLSGESHGEDVLGLLYGAVADEPIPERLRALLNN
jgi:hypothetical protein